MILGIGSDLCDIRRIKRVLDQFGPRFMARTFTLEEQARAEASVTPEAVLAKRFASKEACAKALGVGIRNMHYRDMGVVNDELGRPSLTLTGGARARLEAITPPGQQAVLHLSLSDEWPYSQAFVIIEALPDMALAFSDKATELDRPGGQHREQY
ncbi:MAG: holo-ACP synthase [Asticcacaulis sp.]